MNFIKSNLLTIGVIAIGGVSEYLYYYFIGYASGTTITSNPINSSLYGMLMGGLLFSMFKRKKLHLNNLIKSEIDPDGFLAHKLFNMIKSADF